MFSADRSRAAVSPVAVSVAPEPLIISASAERDGGSGACSAGEAYLRHPRDACEQPPREYLQLGGRLALLLAPSFILPPSLSPGGTARSSYPLRAQPSEADRKSMA